MLSSNRSAEELKMLTRFEVVIIFYMSLIMFLVTGFFLEKHDRDGCVPDQGHGMPPRNYIKIYLYLEGFCLI